MKRYEVVAGILKNKGKFLCGKRGRGFFEKMWEFPGGKIEKGERKEQALIREIKEEIDCDVIETKYYMTVEKEFLDYVIHLDVYFCKCIDLNPKCNVHEEIKWLTLDEMDNYEWCDVDKIIIKRLLDEYKNK